MVHDELETLKVENQRLIALLEQPVDSDSLPGFVRVAMPAPVGTEVGLTLTLPNGITLSGLHPGNIDLLGAIMRQL